MPNAIFPIERFEEIQARMHDFKLLERVPPTCSGVQFPIQLSPPTDDQRPLLVLDLETTGLKLATAKIIELGMVRVTFSPSSGKILSIEDAISLYQDPHEPISAEITELTGITNEMVAGQVFDEAVIEQWLGNDLPVVAHNAGFDRPIFEKRFPQYPALAWACSLKEVDWLAEGTRNLKLDQLLLEAGYFYEGHRASIDCLALAWLFHIKPGAFRSLLDNAKANTAIVRAIGAPFEVKDALKAAGYDWNDGSGKHPRHWHVSVREDHLDAEMKYLNDLYQGGSAKAVIEKQNARMRFRAQ